MFTSADYGFGSIALEAISALFRDRHRGQPLGRALAAPPGMRVRTGRFAKLRSCESGDVNAVEVSHCQHAG